MSDCPNVEIRELLPDYLGGRLSDVRRSEVSSHLASCPNCALALERELPGLRRGVGIAAAGAASL